MLFESIRLLDEELNERAGMYVGVRDGRIAYIGSEAPTEDFGSRYDGRDKLLMSGFYNTHAHTPMTLLRGYGENLTLQSWLNDRIFPFEAKLQGDDVYYATLLGIAESLRFGIVSTTDMYYFCDRMAEAVLESGAKNNISRGVTCFTGQGLWELEAFRESKELFDTYHGAGGGRIRIDMSLHAEYTSTPRVAEELAAFARETGAGMHVHISETKEEHEACKARHGKTPVAYLADLGLLDVRTTAAHCVWVEAEDIAILKEKDVTVANNPVSNLKLASGICPVPALLDAGVRVTVGTDSVASNNSLNFIEELKFFALLHKVTTGDPTVITPRQALYAGTRAGAESQGRNGEGRLAVGAPADLVVFDLSGPHMHPVHDMANNLVYAASGSDVVLTMVDGNVLYRDGAFPTIDIEKVKAETQRSLDRILAGR